MTRFTLRDVFWLTLVVGMGVGWWMRESTHIRQMKYAHGLLHTWPDTVLHPNGSLKEGDVIEIRALDPGLLVQVKTKDGIEVSREFIIEPHHK